MPAKPRTTRRPKRRLPKQSKTLMTLNVIAVAVVAALIVGAVGAAVFDAWLLGDDDNTIEVDPSKPDPVEQGYRDQIDANPNDASAMLALANYLGNTGRVDESIPWYERALQITPDDMVLRLDFAGALASAAKEQDAELQYRKVIDAQPDNAMALLGLARLYRSWSPPRNDDAVTYYQLTIERAGESVVRDVAQQELAEMTGTPVASPSPAA
jgi:cytochrome c-type biogenesis protein CcmH/NrfG